MAKKKAAAPASSPKSTPAAKSAKTNAAPAKPKVAKPAALARSLTREEIGHVAGDVWRALSDNGSQTLASLKKSVGAPDELVVAALGWLAREDKLAFETNGRSVTVSLV